MLSFGDRRAFFAALTYLGLPFLFLAAPLSALLPNHTINYELPYTSALMLALSAFTVVFLEPRKGVLAALLLLFLSTSVEAAVRGGWAAEVAAALVRTLLPTLPYLVMVFILCSCPTRLKPLSLALAVCATHGAGIAFRSFEDNRPPWTKTFHLHYFHIALALAYNFILLTVAFNQAVSLLPSKAHDKSHKDHKTADKSQDGQDGWLLQLAAFFRREPFLQIGLVIPGIFILSLSDRLLLCPLSSMLLWIGPVIFGSTYLAMPQVEPIVAGLLGITFGLFGGSLIFSSSRSLILISLSLSPSLIVLFWSSVPPCTTLRVRKLVVTIMFLFNVYKIKLKAISNFDLNCLLGLLLFSLLFSLLEIVCYVGFRRLETYVHGRSPKLLIDAEKEMEQLEMKNKNEAEADWKPIEKKSSITVV